MPCSPSGESKSISRHELARVVLLDSDGAAEHVHDDEARAELERVADQSVRPGAVGEVHALRLVRDVQVRQAVAERVLYPVSARNAADAGADRGAVSFERDVEHWPGARDGEAAKDGRARRDADGHLEPDPGLTGLRRCANHALRAFGPQAVDEAGDALPGARVELAPALHSEAVLRRCRC